MTDSRPADSPADGASFCKIARPIKWCDRDSALSRYQVLQHNAVGIELCHWTKTTETWPTANLTCADTDLPKKPENPQP